MSYLTDEHHTVDVTREIAAHIDDNISEAEKIMIIDFIERLKESRQNGNTDQQE